MHWNGHVQVRVIAHEAGGDARRDGRNWRRRQPCGSTPRLSKGGVCGADPQRVDVPPAVVEAMLTPNRCLHRTLNRRRCACRLRAGEAER
jgi:hypothetical protein